MIKIPTPGSSVRGSKSGAPIMALFDLLGRRWGMGVLWTINGHGPLTFRDIQKRCDTISPSVLNQRLKELRKAELVGRSHDGYVATEMGQKIYKLLVPLGSVAKEWGHHLTKQKETD